MLLPRGSHKSYCLFPIAYCLKNALIPPPVDKQAAFALSKCDFSPKGGGL